MATGTKEETVIFDLDGTLVQTEEIWEEVRREFVIKHGGCWRDDAAKAMIGMRTTEWGRYIHENLDVKLHTSEIERDVIRDVIAKLDKHVPILPGAEDALERLSRGFRMGMATSAALPVAQEILAKTGWRKYFQVVVSADEVPKGKPSPDVYLRAVQLLGANPKRTAAVEDSSYGIRSAHNAGLAVIAIPNHSFPPDSDALSHAAVVLQSLEELEPATVRSVLR